jgi:hypothetical protein
VLSIPEALQVRCYAEVNEEAMDSGIPGHYRADVVKSLEISFPFSPTSLLFLIAAAW